MPLARLRKKRYVPAPPCVRWHWVDVCHPNARPLCSLRRRSSAFHHRLDSLCAVTLARGNSERNPSITPRANFPCVWRRDGPVRTSARPPIQWLARVETKSAISPGKFICCTPSQTVNLPFNEPRLRSFETGAFPKSTTYAELPAMLHINPAVVVIVIAFVSR